jgi:hypothetical protein
MLKSAAATALALITMLTPAVSAGCVVSSERYSPRSEAECEIAAHGLRSYAIRCGCSAECHQQYHYIVRLHCTTGPCCHEGFEDRLVAPVETVSACYRTCVKAKTGTYP